MVNIEGNRERKASMSEHTPGPWIYDDEHIGVCDDSNPETPITSRICAMIGEHVTCDETDANARLIAAAPRIKGALGHALSILEKKRLNSREHNAVLAFRCILQEADPAGNWTAMFRTVGPS
jgi:hypothetical protein